MTHKYSLEAITVEFLEECLRKNKLKLESPTTIEWERSYLEQDTKIVQSEIEQLKIMKGTDSL